MTSSWLRSVWTFSSFSLLRFPLRGCPILLLNPAPLTSHFPFCYLLPPYCFSFSALFLCLGFFTAISKHRFSLYCMLHIRLSSLLSLTWQRLILHSSSPIEIRIIATRKHPTATTCHSGPVTVQIMLNSSSSSNRPAQQQFIKTKSLTVVSCPLVWFAETDPTEAAVVGWSYSGTLKVVPTSKCSWQTHTPLPSI